MVKKCFAFAASACVLRCPNAEIDAIDDYWDGPAAEDMGLTKIKCKDCGWNTGECKDCMFEGNDEYCPERRKQ